MAKTMIELRREHRMHVGFIWLCPKCADEWKRLKQQEQSVISDRAASKIHTIEQKG